jgi:hypothetical protein
MSLPAQSPQGDRSTLPRKAALFNSLKANFVAAAQTPPTLVLAPAPSTAPTPTPAAPVLPVAPPKEEEELINKLFNADAAPAPSTGAVPVLSPVAPQVSQKPSQTQEEKEEFSTEFLSSLLPEEEAPSLVAALPTAVAQAASTSLNPAQPKGSTVKEAGPVLATSEAPQLDIAAGVQFVESEPRAEISPEVESFLTQVENHQEQLPQEVVIADQQLGDISVQPMAQPVIVLPITQEMEKEAAHKSSSFSIRWLVEWSHKMMKIFAGRIVYKPESARES